MEVRYITPNDNLFEISNIYEKNWDLNVSSCVFWKAITVPEDSMKNMALPFQETVRPKRSAEKNCLN